VVIPQIDVDAELVVGGIVGSLGEQRQVRLAIAVPVADRDIDDARRIRIRAEGRVGCKQDCHKDESTHARLPFAVNQTENNPVDNGTRAEQNKNIRAQESQMTDMIRDIAAFTSIAMFIASFSLICMVM
jgi:hypothetical protein